MRQRIHRDKTADSAAVHSYKMMYGFEEHNGKLFFGQRTNEEALTRKQKLECFLRYVGDPGYQMNVGEQLSINQGTVSRTVHEVADKIVSKCKHYIHFPTITAKVNVAKKKVGKPLYSP